MVNPQQLMRDQLTSKIAFDMAKNEFKIELEQLAGARAEAARLRSSNEEKDAALVDLQQQIDRQNESLTARLAEAAAESERANVAERGLQNRRAEAKAAAHDASMAVHESAVHQRIQLALRELAATNKQAQKQEAKAAKVAAKEKEKAHEQALEGLRAEGEMARAAMEVPWRRQAAASMHRMATARGIAHTELEHYRRAEAKRAETGGDVTLRKKLAVLEKEVADGRRVVLELREQLRTAEQQLAEERNASKAKAKLIAPRTSSSPNAPLTARSIMSTCDACARRQTAPSRERIRPSPSCWPCTWRMGQQMRSWSHA